MPELRVITGNIFTSKCQTLVNTVNCVGVMGAGIALECKLRFPQMYDRYEELCRENKIRIGTLWIFKSVDRWILNFPTKQHWKFPTKEEYLHSGLEKFMDTYEDRGVTSVAFPVLGAQNGGLSQSRSIDIMESYLRNCSIDVEIYQYDPEAADDVFDSFKHRMLTTDAEELKFATGLSLGYIHRIQAALQTSDMCQLNQLANVKGIGEKTLEKAFAFVRDQKVTRMDLDQPGLDF